MGLEPAFADVDDTPMFRQRVTELEAATKKVRDRCDAFLAGAKRYKEGVVKMQDCSASFASSLKEFFNTGTEEDPLTLGPMLPLATTLQELGENYDKLRKQLENSVVDPLQKDILEIALASAKEENKRYDKKQTEAEAARVKYMALKKVTKREVIEKSRDEWKAAERAAEDSRYEMARRVNELESYKRYMALEVLNNGFLAQLRFYQDGLDSMLRVQPLMEQAQAKVKQLKAEQEFRARSLNDMIFQHRQQVEQREQTVEAHTNAVPLPDTNTVQLNVGPIQMASSKASLMAEIESLIRNTQHSGGERVTIIKQGYLSKKSQKHRSDWKRRFFVLDSNGVLYYYSHRDNLLSLSKQHKPKNTVRLLTSTVKMDGEDTHMSYCFQVVSPEGTYNFLAESDLERQEWIDALQAVINCLLTGAVDPNRVLPRTPIRATHSRHNSYSDGESALGGDFSPSVADGLAPSAFAFTPLLTPVPSNESIGGGGGDGMQSSNSGLSSLPSGSGRMTSTSGSLRGPPAANDWRSLGAGGSDTLERLRRVPGNRTCVDCGASDPDWASLNLGVLLCIECSGIHRQLGVHISKVRSCTLDVKVWEEPILEVFERIGNDASNRVWEARLQQRRKVEPWMWVSDDDSDDDESARITAGDDPEHRRHRRSSSADATSSGATTPTASTTSTPMASAAGSSVAGSTAGQQGRPRRRDALPSSGSVPMALSRFKPKGGKDGTADEEPPAALPSKPSVSSPLSEKQKYIIDKYVNRLLCVVLPKAQAQSRLWEAAEAGNLVGALEAIAGGADINASYRTPSALKLVTETHSLSHSDPSGAHSEPSACGNVTALHATAALNFLPMIEFLLQNGATWEQRDIFMRTPLHYAVIHGNDEGAKALLKRSANAGGSDAAAGLKGVLDLFISRGRVQDEELFQLLTKHS